MPLSAMVESAGNGNHRFFRSDRTWHWLFFIPIVWVHISYCRFPGAVVVVRLVICKRRDYVAWPAACLSVRP